MAFQAKSRVLRVATHGKGIYEIGPFSPGRTPDVTSYAGTQLKVTKGSGSTLNLTWGAACSNRSNDYAVYEGTPGTWYSHAKRSCSTSGATSTSITPAGSTSYFLVVPRDGQSEGSYGVNSSGVEIPAATPSTSQCVGQPLPVNCL